jgi:hypothetical protein
LFHWSYAEASDLVIYEEGKINSTTQSNEGTKQGGPMSAFSFDLLIQSLYQRTDQMNVGGNKIFNSKADHDDLTLVFIREE